MATSLCLTIKNENLDLTLKRILSQSALPDEIVIVDAGDKEQYTLSRNYKIYKKYNIRYIQEKCNRSEGRNRCAGVATCENLVFIDGGCAPQKNWFKTMRNALNAKGAEIIAGAYISKIHKFYDYLLDKFLNQNDFYPSARNFAMKKTLYKKNRGFREDLTTGEDLEFFKRLVDRGHKIQKAADAVVVWDLPDFLNYLKKIFWYSAGDGRSGIWWDKRKKLATHNVQLLFNTARCVILVGVGLYGYVWLAALFYIIYLASSAYKHKVSFTRFAGLNPFLIAFNSCEFTVIKLATDLSSIAGFIFGLIVK